MKDAEWWENEELDLCDIDEPDLTNVDVNVILPIAKALTSVCVGHSRT